MSMFCFIYVSTIMKYQKGKIKMEHHHLKEFTKTLEHISKIDEVKRIIP